MDITKALQQCKLKIQILVNQLMERISKDYFQYDIPQIKI